MATLELPDDELQALIDIYTHAAEVDWLAYDQARQRIIDHQHRQQRQQWQPINAINANIPPKEMEPL